MVEKMKNEEKVLSTEKQENIIRAARSRFAHYGFSKVTMDEIAADVDMGKASLYYYFPTKESLFVHVIRQEQDEAAAELESIIGRKISPEEKLVEYANVRLNLFQKLLNLGTLSVHSLTDSNSIYKKQFIEFEGKELKFVQKIIQAGIASGEFRKDLEKEFPAVLLHIFQGLRFRVLKQSRGITIEPAVIKELQKEMSIAINLIIKGILK